MNPARYRRQGGAQILNLRTHNLAEEIRLTCEDNDQNKAPDEGYEVREKSQWAGEDGKACLALSGGDPAPGRTGRIRRGDRPGG